MIGLPDLSAESIKLLLVLTIIVLGVAVTLIGYFMSKRDSAITEATANLTEAVGQLKMIVNNLQTQSMIRQPIIDEQLRKHLTYIEKNAENIETIDKRLGKVETEHRLLHCNYVKRKPGKTNQNETN